MRLIVVLYQVPGRLHHKHMPAFGRQSIISSLVAGFHLFDVQGMFFADLRLEAFEVAEVLLRQLLLRRRDPIPYDD